MLPRASHRRLQEGGKRPFCLSPHKSTQSGSDGTDLSKPAAQPLFFRFEAGPSPSYVAGCPLPSVVRALPIPTAPRATSAGQPRAPRQGQGWHVPPAGPAPPRTHQQVAARPSPVARWMDSGGQGGTRAGQRGGSSSVTPGQGQAAAATATPQAPATTATTGASSSQRSAETTATAPPKKKAADWPRPSRTSHPDWLLLPPRLRPPRRSADWLTSRVRWRIRCEGAGRAGRAGPAVAGCRAVREG